MYLIDTHIFYWFINADLKLPDHIRDIILKEDNVYISICSFWEMTVKASIGKLELKNDIVDLINDCEQIGINVLPIKAEHLSALSVLPFVHRDPFDRMIISQAMAEDLTLITADEKILMYDCVKTLSEQGGSQ